MSTLGYKMVIILIGNIGENLEGCIIKNKETSSDNIAYYMNEIGELNWLITDMECYPKKKENLDLFNKDFCWISGECLNERLQSESWQWIWAVFSGFNKEINIDDVMKYPQPYADGYRGFWKNPLTIQHPMAKVELVVWDGICVLIISDDDRIVQKVKSTTKAEDLKEYNNK